MKEVDLSGTNLDDEKAAILSTCLHNVEVLNVSKCELTANGIQYIAKAIEQKNAQVLAFVSLPISPLHLALH